MRPFEADFDTVLFLPIVFVIINTMTSVSFFLDHRGNNPVGDFLDKNKQIKVKTSIIIKNIIEFGLISAIPHIKKLSGLPLWEIRILGMTFISYTI